MLRLKRYKEGVWFDVPGLEGVRVKVRPISYTETTRILTKHKKKVKVEGEIVDDYDEVNLTLDLFKYILEDFEGISLEEDASKDEIKEAIFDYDFLRDFISEKAKELRELKSKEYEEDLKN